MNTIIAPSTKVTILYFPIVTELLLFGVQWEAFLQRGGDACKILATLLHINVTPPLFFFFFFNALSLQGISYHISFCRLLFLYLWNARNCWAKIMECFPLALFMISNSSPFSQTVIHKSLESSVYPVIAFGGVGGVSIEMD